MQWLDRADRLLLALVEASERAAVAAALWRGHGDEFAADQAAVEAMHRAFKDLPLTAKVVIGEGEEGDSSLFYSGEILGSGNGLSVDIGADPLEGTTICAKNLPNSLSVLIAGGAGKILPVPEIYMDKIAVGPGYAAGIVDLNVPPEENIEALARAKGVPSASLTACILDRPRNQALIEAVRRTGASIRLIGDGDVAGVIDVADPAASGIDIYLGIGNAPQGVLAAAALRCLGGQMEGRLVLASAEHHERAERAGLADPSRKYGIEDLAGGDVIFVATGVTDGTLVEGVEFTKERIITQTIAMSSAEGTVRTIRTERHRWVP